MPAKNVATETSETVQKARKSVTVVFQRRRVGSSKIIVGRVRENKNTHLYKWGRKTSGGKVLNDFHTFVSNRLPYSYRSKVPLSS